MVDCTVICIYYISLSGNAYFKTPNHLQEKLVQMCKTVDIQGEHQTYFISTKKQP